MEDGNNKPEPAVKPAPVVPHMNILHVIIAVAVIVLAVIFIAKFGFNMDLISPYSGEMAIVKRPVNQVPTLIQNPAVKPVISLRPDLRTIPVTAIPCSAPQSRCGDSCIDITNDPDNCGSCGNVCPAYNSTDRTCTSGKCSNACLSGYYDCNKNPADGCESDLHDNDNCGRCGEGCGNGWFCLMGQCVTGGGGPQPYVPPQRL